MKLFRNRKTYVFVLLISAMPAHVLAQDDAPDPEAPNVLFISIDDLSDWIGPLDGHAQTKTPNLGRLAAMGITFTNAHVPATVCNPSRTAIMTGIRPSNSGVYGNTSDWRKVERLQGLPTIPRFFKNAGYKTTGAGKLFHASTYNPWAYFGYNDMAAWDGFFPSLERQLPDEVGPHSRPANGSPHSPNFDWSAVATTDMAMGDGQVVNWSIQNIVAEGSVPRFNAVGIYRPHPPWYVPQKYLDMHPLDDIILPLVIDDDLADIPEIALRGGREGGMPAMGIHDWIIEDPSNIRWKEGVQAYLASISFADAMLGHLLDALEQSGRAENTIVVLWSDQGWHLGEKQRWRKTTLWRETTRVPFIVVAPGVTQPGSRSTTAVSLMDLYPTLVELAGLDVPNHVEGVSLVPILRNSSTPSERRVVSTNGFKNHAVSGEQYRYLRYADGSEELYDIQSDPHEWKNLAADPAMAAIKAELAEWLPTHNEPDVGRNRD